MLEEHLDQEKYDEIVQRSTLPTIEITQYAQELLDVISVSKLATVCIRVALYQAGFKLSFNLVSSHDADSLNNPLRQVTGERAASIHTIIYIMNQLFISNNDLVTLDWIENEYCKTGRSKWDGVILKVNDKKTSPALVEFSGGSKVNAIMNKEACDINKLSSNMVSIVADLPDNVYNAPYGGF
ncbi:hypothetical protein CU098_005824 [Rhizopus stolonifer]|uniref:Uncharacterized protein n=1 Tax=Rhizopus stolonifer TaxID=4846 RepID=A0A367ISK6_RHIST|nr:hypothetical protein CU098_005824 [Rhizopus stolonifer]